MELLLVVVNHENSASIPEVFTNPFKKKLLKYKKQ